VMGWRIQMGLGRTEERRRGKVRRRGGKRERGIGMKREGEDDCREDVCVCVCVCVCVRKRERDRGGSGNKVGLSKSREDREQDGKDAKGFRRYLHQDSR
jgi:hypothetical protein